MIDEALDGIRVVGLTTNIPGPVALRQLVDLGAGGIKIEPPGGDLLELVAPDWYASLCNGIEVRRLDLKEPEALAELKRELDGADLLLTTVRERALSSLGLDPDSLAEACPRLCQVLICGYPPPNHNRAGHDINYQAEAGLLSPPAMPATLIADLAGAERAVSAALALLLRRTRTGRGGHAFVPLATAAQDFAKPVLERLVGDNEVLGGATPFYGCYRTADDCWIACGLLEPHFIETFSRISGLADLDDEALAEYFRGESAAHWEQWGRRHDLPISRVKGKSGC